MGLVSYPPVDLIVLNRVMQLREVILVAVGEGTNAIIEYVPLIIERT